MIGRPPALAILGLLAVACAAPPGPPPPADPLALPSSGPDGLQATRYAIRAGAPELEAVTAAFATRPWPSPAQRRDLSDAGLQMAVIRAADADEIRRRLGPVSEVARTEIGVAPSWVDIVERRVPAGVAAGIVPGWQEGPLDMAALAVRGWVVPDTDGGRVDLELAMHVMRGETRRLANAGAAPTGWTLRASAIACSLREGEALLVLPRPPAPRGKGPAADGSAPATCGSFLLGEPDPARGQVAEGGFATALLLVARLPVGIQPAPTASLDTPTSVGDTGDEIAP